MSEGFDPYHVWLGIPADQQPPNCYRLLGIRLFEDRPEVIQHAAEQRMGNLKSLAAGPHAAAAQKLLNEVAAARVRLLDPYKKKMYDQSLREELQAGGEGEAAGGGPGRLGQAEAKPHQPEQKGAPRQAALPPRPLGLGSPGPADQPTATWVPLGKLGEYELLEKLGEGGMGTVYKALHRKLGRLVALKVLPKDRRWDEQAIARFEREMKAVGAVDHPNIVRAMDAREVQGVRFLVMEYVEGLDLNALGRACHPMGIAEVCEIIRQAALGLEEVHRHRLVHRDVKPSNLMVTPQGVVKLLDLGLARFGSERSADQEVTGTGAILGTVDYMAPEQVTESHSVDIRADIYSLGCTFYKLLTGRTPFSGPGYQTAVAKMAGHVRDPVPPVRRLRGDVPAELARIVERMLAKEPGRRFATPVEVADAVGPLAATGDLAGLVARALGQTAQQAPPVQAEQVTEPVRSSSSMTEFFQQLVGAVTGRGASAARPRRAAPTRTIFIASIAAALLVLAVAGVWLVWSQLAGTAE
ncbi:MAG: serine/threonine-protein kinase, partial [Thermoguttaceae bacterium]